MKKIAHSMGDPSILVNNAGIAAYSEFATMSPAEMERMVRTNLLGVLHCTRALLPAMRAARRGAIVNVGSIAGLIPVPHMSVYSATKWAVTGLSESLNAELAREGIHVGVVCPFIVETPLTTRQEARGGRSIPHAFALKSATVARAVIEVITKERDLIVLPRTLGAVAAAQMSTGPMLRWTLRRTAGLLKPRPPARRGKEI
jgi:short-subunit dehydrogenase